MCVYAFVISQSAESARVEFEKDVLLSAGELAKIDTMVAYGVHYYIGNGRASR